MRAVALKNPSDTELGVEHYVSSHGHHSKLFDRPLQSCFHIPFVVGHFRKPHSSLAIGATRHFFVKATLGSTLADLIYFGWMNLAVILQAFGLSTCIVVWDLRWLLGGASPNLICDLWGWWFAGSNLLRLVLLHCCGDSIGWVVTVVRGVANLIFHFRSWVLKAIGLPQLLAVIVVWAWSHCWNIFNGHVFL